MTKILVECPQCIPSVRVGVLAPLAPLAAAKLCELRYRDTKEITCADIQWCDCLVCVRGCEYPSLRVVQAARRAGRFLIYFLDDDLLNIPRGNASTSYYSDNKIQVNLTKIESLCDVLWAVNARILSQYGKWCDRTVLSRVPAKILRPPMTVDTCVRVLYAGSVDHSGLVREKLAPAVRRLTVEMSGRVEFTFVGADPGFRNLPGVTYKPFFENYEDYQAMLARTGFSIGLAPAYDTPFYACKYYNKFVEYTTFGIAGIYENCPPYTQIVRDGETGFLSGPSPEDWYLRLKEAVENPAEARAIAYRAQTVLTLEFSPADIARRLQEDVPELVHFAAPAKEAAEISLPPMRWLFYRERIQLLCRIYGVLAVFIILWKIIKKLWKLLKKQMRGK